MSSNNPYLLVAAGEIDSVFDLLRSDSALASAQDEHGYSLLHAAASYNSLDLLRALVNEFSVDVNLKDEDGETCLFVTETVDAAKCLVEELNVDTSVKNDDDQTAEEKIISEDEFPEIAQYLQLKAAVTQGLDAAIGTTSSNGASESAPPLPPNVKVEVGTMPEQQVNGDEEQPDPEFRRRIEELAARDDFNDEAGQRALRDLITDAVQGVSSEERDVRRRLE